ncbi:peptide-methionine (S)-S-oxide reductase MsrA [Halonotius roseus]|jgi:peptide-methionine (S)-S-oxide reductase|uniref:Peptide methionine sulfoxide reductase MsrA n=1 Tax=Halonotius roseus TaxID=2511997 RepID=A0A544QLF5_9EURY|nr:peptide-methionine (S)-S-oxide reductase MsrA [Halonotius roseus]TQQ79430.1 peptide-methionine (S)-S-oxide reductase [Halonotius roseus]
MAPTAATIEAYDRDAPSSEATETATFALGCFWGPDAQFGALDGVVRTRVGYAGGTKTDPTYHDLGDHTEAFQVDYDPETRSFAELLDLVFRSHDPNQQTRKTQYQNIVFIASADQRETLTDYLDANGYTADGIATRIEQFSRFYPAEDYHQKYNLRNKRSIMNSFEDAGYDDEAIRESPAAAKLNGHVVGHEISDDHDLGIASNRSVHST